MNLLYSLDWLVVLTIVHFVLFVTAVVFIVLSTDLLMNKVISFIIIFCVPIIGSAIVIVVNRKLVSIARLKD
jgi:hypothetical protein